MTEFTNEDAKRILNFVGGLSPYGWTTDALLAKRPSRSHEQLRIDAREAVLSLYRAEPESLPAGLQMHIIESWELEEMLQRLPRTDITTAFEGDAELRYGETKGAYESYYEDVVNEDFLAAVTKQCAQQSEPIFQPRKPYGTYPQPFAEGQYSKIIATAKETAPFALAVRVIPTELAEDALDVAPKAASDMAQSRLVEIALARALLSVDAHHPGILEITENAKGIPNTFAQCKRSTSPLESAARAFQEWAEFAQNSGDEEIEREFEEAFGISPDLVSDGEVESMIDFFVRNERFPIAIAIASTDEMKVAWDFAISSLKMMEVSEIFHVSQDPVTKSFAIEILPTIEHSPPESEATAANHDSETPAPGMDR